MTNHEIRYELMKYYAKDFNCAADDFLQDTNKVYSNNHSDDPFFRMICFGNAAIANVNEEIYEWCKNFISKYVGFRCFDGVQMSIICRELSKYDFTVSCGQGAFPNMNFVRKINHDLYNIRIIGKDEIVSFYRNEIYGSFYPDNKEWHMLNYEDGIDYIAANYENGRVTGFATAERCTDKIYDLGVETLTECQQKGVATAVTSAMTNMLLDMDVIPYIHFAWSNIASKNTAIKSGYLLACSTMINSDRNNWAEKVYRGETE